MEPLPDRDQLTASPLSYPSAHWAGDLQLRGSGLKPPHSVLSRRVVPAAHSLKGELGFKNPAQCRLKVKIFNLKVKEKDKEYTNTARQAKLWKIIKNIEGER
jgi:hypothetical protein